MLAHICSYIFFIFIHEQYITHFGNPEAVVESLSKAERISNQLEDLYIAYQNHLFKELADHPTNKDPNIRAEYADYLFFLYTAMRQSTHLSYEQKAHLRAKALESKKMFGIKNLLFL